MYTLDELDREALSPVSQEANWAIAIRTGFGAVSILLLILFFQGIFVGHEEQKHVHAEGAVSIVRAARDE